MTTHTMVLVNLLYKSYIGTEGATTVASTLHASFQYFKAKSRKWQASAWRTFQTTVLPPQN